MDRVLESSRLRRKYSTVLFQQWFEVEVFHDSSGGFPWVEIFHGLLCYGLGVQEDNVDYLLVEDGSRSMGIRQNIS